MEDILEKYTLFWKKSDLEERYQCNECGMMTDLVNGVKGLVEWDKTHEGCKGHHAAIPQDEEKVEEPVIEETEPPPADPDPVDPPADPEPTDDEEAEEEEEELTREGLEDMTKKEIMKAYAPDWDGTKKALIKMLLDEED